MNSDITEWIIINIDALKELIQPLQEKKKEAFTLNDVVFHQDIEAQYRDIAREMICTEISKHLACSTESIYDSIEDSQWEDLWTKIF